MKLNDELKASVVAQLVKLLTTFLGSPISTGSSPDCCTSDHLHVPMLMTAVEDDLRAWSSGTVGELGEAPGSWLWSVPSHCDKREQTIRLKKVLSL